MGEDEGVDEDGCIARFSDSYRPADRLVRLERSLDSAKLLLFESVPHPISYTTIHFADNTCQCVVVNGCAVSSPNARVRSLPSFTMAGHSLFPSGPTRRCRGRHGQGLALHALRFKILVRIISASVGSAAHTSFSVRAILALILRVTVAWLTLILAIPVLHVAVTICWAARALPLATLAAITATLSSTLVVSLAVEVPLSVIVVAGATWRW